MKVSELSFPFCLPSGRLSEAEKNSVRLKENRGECYKALDATGIFVDTWHPAMLRLWQDVEAGTAREPREATGDTVKKGDAW